MATRLYPPLLENTIPAFYGTSIEVPFAMNSTVDKSQIEGFMLQIKSLTSNSALISNIISNNYNIEKQTVKFILPQVQLSKLNVGQYYKIQIAYLPQGYSSEKTELLEHEAALQEIKELAVTSSVTESLRQLQDKYRAALAQFFDYYLDADESLLRARNISNDTDWAQYWNEACLQTLQQNIVRQLRESAQLTLDTDTTEEQYQEVTAALEDYEKNLNSSTFAEKYAELKAAFDRLDSNTVMSADLGANSVRGIFDALAKSAVYNNKTELTLLDGCTNAEVVERAKKYYNTYVNYLTLYDTTTNAGFANIKQVIVDKMSRAIEVCRDKLNNDSSDLYPIVGYFSSVAMAKYTSSPTVEIQGLKSYSTAAQKGEYVGQYSNSDISERVKYYSFYIYDENGELVDSATEQIHNNSLDNITNGVGVSSSDSFTPKVQLDKDKVYIVQYVVTTTNNMEIKSPAYQVVRRAMISLGDIRFYATPDDSNGCVKLQLDIAHGLVELSGTYLLSRIHEQDGKTYKERLKKINFAYDLTSTNPYVDYTVEHGVAYQYIIERVNSSGVYSLPTFARLGPVPSTDSEAEESLTRTTYVTTNFEDAFLYDGKRQLKIRYNPKVSSFKKTILETKTDTIGGKYPFVFRNGSVSYKEFPISGLISRLENKLFDNRYAAGAVKRDQTPSLRDIEAASRTDLTDENFYKERQFKLEVLDFLTNGKPKLFRSPAEGNYLVRLMNTSLTPEDRVSRMLHTFNCTAYEIGECDYDDLIKYNIIDGDTEIANKVVQYSSVVITPGTKKNENLFSMIGSAIQSFLIDNVEPNSIILIDDEPIMIGATGMYEVPSGAAISSIKLPSDGTAPTQGVITVGYEGYTTTAFDGITEATVKEIPAEIVTGKQDIGDSYSPIILLPEMSNILNTANKKEYVGAIKYLRFMPRPLEQVKVASVTRAKELVNSNSSWLVSSNNVERPSMSSIVGRDTIQNFASFPVVSRLPLYYFTSDNLPWYAERATSAQMRVFDLGHYYMPATRMVYTFAQWKDESGNQTLPVSYFNQKHLYEVSIIYAGTGEKQTFSVAPDHPIELSGEDLSISQIMLGPAVYLEVGYETAENSFSIEGDTTDTDLMALKQKYNSAYSELVTSRDEPISAKLSTDDYLDWYTHKIVLERKYNFAKDAYFKAVEKRLAQS